MHPAKGIHWGTVLTSLGTFGAVVVALGSLCTARDHFGMSQQKMYDLLSNLVVKTLTSGRLRTLFHLLLSWSIDPDLVVEGGWGWNLSYKALGVGFVGFV
jgi:hypothetical protein